MVQRWETLLCSVSTLEDISMIIFAIIAPAGKMPARKKIVAIKNS